MCLISKSKWTIAKGDIVCYKCLYPIKKKPFWKRWFSFFKYYYITPYRYSKIKDKILKPKEKHDGVMIIDDKYVIEEGFIHTYNTFYKPSSKYHIFKCIIPDGTRYYYNELGFASKEIIFKERVA